MPTNDTASAIPQVYTAINRVQASLATEGITKDRKNQQQGYSFRGIDDVYNAISGLMAMHHLCMLPRHSERTVETRQSKAGGDLFFVSVRSDFDLICALDGSRHTVTTYGEAMDSADKATNKAMSAAMKYACLQAFQIPTQGDNDADNVTHEPRAQNGARQSSQPSQESRSQTSTAKNGTGSTSKTAADAPMKPTTAWITEATHSRLESYRKTEEGEKVVQALLAHWKLKDFNELIESEAQKAISWIAEEIKEVALMRAASNSKKNSPSNHHAA